MSDETLSGTGLRRIRKQLTRPANCLRWGFQLSSVETIPGVVNTVITDITPNTPAATSEFLPDDVIESANGQNLFNAPFEQVKAVFREPFLDIVCLRGVVAGYSPSSLPQQPPPQATSSSPVRLPSPIPRHAPTSAQT